MHKETFQRHPRCPDVLTRETLSLNFCLFIRKHHMAHQDQSEHNTVCAFGVCLFSCLGGGRPHGLSANHLTLNLKRDTVQTFVHFVFASFSSRWMNFWDRTVCNLLLASVKMKSSRWISTCVFTTHTESVTSTTRSSPAEKSRVFLFIFV